ncbi:unnamed protein product [Peronospora farinosa]|uniref:Zinc finger PHD-type domain-containing protein n=1 Tax=Peronospora farinosa TaxID=134698 RepID=A0ABN8C1Z8_9STRA|nr:unnamed protein product [Peronospora farinosa]
MSAHTSTKNVCVNQNLRYSECDLMDRTTHGYQVRVCEGCELAVHEKCYAIAPLTTEEEVQSSEIEQQNEDMKSSEWLCDCCRRGVQRQMIKCVYCEKTAGVTAFKVVDTGDAAFWSLFAGFQDEKKPTIENEVQFGHVLCIKWDPRRLAVHTIKESKIQAAMMVSKKDLVKKSAEKTVTEGGYK